MCVDDGQHVVTAVAVDDHWLPLWLAPDGQVLQVHTFNDEYASRARIEKILHAIASRLGFRDMTVHRDPQSCPRRHQVWRVCHGLHCTCHHSHAIARDPTGAATHSTPICVHLSLLICTKY